MSNVPNNVGYPYSMTCEYSPAGNIVNDGYFAANVKPLVTSAAPSLKAPLASLAAAAGLALYLIN